MSDTRIFVSHAHDESRTVALFVDLITSSGCPRNAIFCTSMRGQGVRTGRDFDRDIRQKLLASEIVVAILSERYFASTYCMFELGGAWASDKPLFPYLLPVIKAADVRAPLDQLHCSSIK